VLHSKSVVDFDVRSSAFGMSRLARILQSRNKEGMPLRRGHPVAMKLTHR
jgi:hypothetical protein